MQRDERRRMGHRRRVAAQRGTDRSRPNRSGAFLPAVVTRRQAETGWGGGERTGMFMFPVANRSRGWQPSRIRRWPARNVPSVGAAGSIGSSHRLRCTTYEFLTWTTRVTWCTMDVNGTRVVASRVCRAETLHFATFVGCVCTDRLWR